MDVKTINGVVEGSLNTSLQWSIFGLKVILWVIVYLLCLEFEVGALFVIFSAFYIILSNLGNRSKNHWEPSAYSVFNPDCQAIDGTINPEQFEKEIRYGFWFFIFLKSKKIYGMRINVFSYLIQLTKYMLYISNSKE